MALRLQNPKKKTRRASRGENGGRGDQKPKLSSVIKGLSGRGEGRRTVLSRTPSRRGEPGLSVPRAREGLENERPRSSCHGGPRGGRFEGKKWGHSLLEERLDLFYWETDPSRHGQLLDITQHEAAGDRTPVDNQTYTPEKETRAYLRARSREKCYGP